MVSWFTLSIRDGRLDVPRQDTLRAGRIYVQKNWPPLPMIENWILLIKQMIPTNAMEVY
jgi:hypothetical protein